jgi:hypothetical protein
MESLLKRLDYYFLKPDESLMLVCKSGHRSYYESIEELRSASVCKVKTRKIINPKTKRIVTYAYCNRKLSKP